MERTMSVEDKIRRAEQIYARKQGGKTNQTTLLNVDNKKDIHLLKKMIIQIVICVVIYLLIYVIQNSNYIFSQDFLNKIHEVISYDTNFVEIYENIKNNINGVITKNKDNNQQEENIGGAVEIVENKEEELKNPEEVSQTEVDIQTAKNTTTFIQPLTGTISSIYGQREPTTSSVPKNHTGTDIAAPIGTKIISATDGEVVLNSSEGDYGKHLKIQIGEISIIYAHCNNIYVNHGDKITQGQEIAEVGTTGNSTGPHLHFEIRVSERTIDPQTILEL